MDRLMIEYLRNKGMNGMNEQEFMSKFKDFMAKYRRNSMRGSSMRYSGEGDFMPMSRMDDFYMKRHGGNEELMDMFDSDDRFFDRFNRHSMEDEDMYRMMRYMRHSMNDGDHFSDSEARYIVADMYHTEKGKRHSGEKYDMHKAKEVCERYKGILPHTTTPADVYVALNSQYHDYAELFKNWFGENIDQKIVESAIVFWFKDADCKVENKILEYFKQY